MTKPKIDKATKSYLNSEAPEPLNLYVSLSPSVLSFYQHQTQPEKEKEREEVFKTEVANILKTIDCEIKSYLSAIGAVEIVIDKENLQKLLKIPHIVKVQKKEPYIAVAAKKKKALYA